MIRGIYLDAQGTEQLRPEALSEIQHLMTDGFGNPSATAHARGRSALARLEESRERLAELLDADAEGVVFCSGASEANNFALRSLVGIERSMITSSIEHKSVSKLGLELTRSGIASSKCGVSCSGTTDLHDLRSKLSKRKSIVSVMHANNETGVIQPIEEIAKICRENESILHVDAAQTAGKIPVSFKELDADAMTISGHKFGGPVGSGALIVRPELLNRLRPLIIGGGQEFGYRAGTTPLALVGGMVAALEAATEDMPKKIEAMREKRNHMIEGISDLPGFFINGSLENRLACNFSGGFEGIDAQLVMRQAPHLQMATGSACTTSRMKSHVLMAMGISAMRQRSTLRISLSWSTTSEEVSEVIESLRNVVSRWAV